MHFLKSWNCPGKTRGISKLSKTMRVIYSKNRPKQAFGYWLITQNQKKIVLTPLSFNGWQLQVNEQAVTKKLH